jgi:hypothetical protein
MNSKGNFQKKIVISVISVAKPKNIVVFAFTYVLERFALFIWRFLYGFIKCWQRWSDEAMKRGDEALNASSL